MNFTWTTTPATQESFSCFLDGIKSNCSSGTAGKKQYTGLAVGSHSFFVSAKQTGHFRAVQSNTISWTIDHTGPSAPWITPPASPSNNQTPSVAFGDLDDASTIAGYACVLGTTTPPVSPPTVPNGCVSPWTPATPLDGGSYTLYVYAFDNTVPTSNPSAPGSATWSVDLTKPGAPSLTATPAKQSSATSATFSWTDEAGSTSSCTLNGGQTLSPCGGVSQPRTITYDNLTEGDYTFVVTDTDSANNVGASVTYPWHVDLTRPDAPVVNGPPATTDSTSATFSYSDRDKTASFLCQLGGVGGFTPCQRTYGPLGDGKYELDVEAKDPAGNVSDVTPYQWTIDTTVTGPVAMSPVQFVNTPDGFSNEASPTFTWLALDDTTTGFLCALDSASFTPCGAPDINGGGALQVSVTTETPHVFAVEATDGTNVSPPLPWRWTYDKTPPPAPVFSSEPGDPSNTTSAFFSFASEPNATFTCSLDGAVVEPCATPWSKAGLAETSHTFVVTASDAAGNTSSTSYTWSVDLSSTPAPVMTGPSGYSNSSSAQFSWTDSATGVTFTCVLDGAVLSSCDNPTQLSGLSDAPHRFAVSASNGTKSSTATRSWTVDTTKPVLSLANVPAEGTSTGATAITPDASQTDNNPGTITCVLDGPSPSNTCGPYQGLTAGVYAMTVNTTDLAGNAADPVVRHWTVVSTAPSRGPVDSTPPTAALAATSTLKGGSTATFSETVHGLSAGGAALVLTGTSTVVPSNVVCLSGTTVVACAGNFNALRVTPKSALMPGQHYTVRLLANAVQDSSGNQLAATSVNFRGSRAEQETTPGVKTLWATAKSKAAYGGSFVRENTAGASAAYTFTGTNVTWWTTTGPNQGKATVFIDGVKKAVVNNYAAAAHSKVARKYGKLANKRHTIRIVVRGVKGAKAGTGTFVTVDAYSVGKKTVNTPALTTGWRSLAAKQLSGGHAAVAQVKGESLTFAFRGTGISWVTERSRTQGKVAVYIDGVKKAVVDNYAAATKFGVKRTLTGLADKVHTLKLVVLGTHHKGGTGTWVTVDRFLVT